MIRFSVRLSLYFKAFRIPNTSISLLPSKCSAAPTSSNLRFFSSEQLRSPRIRGGPPGRGQEEERAGGEQPADNGAEKEGTGTAATAATAAANDGRRTAAATTTAAATAAAAATATATHGINKP